MSEDIERAKKLEALRYKGLADIRDHYEAERAKINNEDIERLKEIKEAASPVRRQLSGGDAGVIVGLLAFILVWVGGWVWGFIATDSNPEGLKWYETLFVLLIVAGPPLWASNMIKHIIGKDD